MAGSEQNIIGGRELDELLQTLPAKIEKNIMRSALRAGANVLRDRAKELAPKDDGYLQQSIRVVTRARGGQVSASVKAGNSIAFYAHMVEYGTRPHTIKAKRAQALFFNGKAVKDVAHPGARPKPFMRPAADAGLAASVAAVQQKVRERLTKAGIEVPEQADSDNAVE